MKNIEQKIEALLNKTEANGASKAEAISAMQKAELLMRKHHITAKPNSLKKEDCVSVEHYYKVPAQRAFEPVLNNVTKLFDCKCYVTSLSRVSLASGRRSKSQKRYVLFGFKNDLKLADYFINFVLRAYRFELSEFQKTEKYMKFSAASSKRKINNMFFLGFMEEIYGMLEEFIKAKYKSEEESQGTGLIRVPKRKIVEEAFKIKLEPASKPRSISVYGEVVKQGSQQAKKVQLRQGVNQAKGTKMLNS